MIEIKNLSKKFQEKQVLSDVSLKIDKQRILALIGPSGCGKTTLLRMIAGLESPDRGTITIDGLCASNSKGILAPHERRLGMIFQDLALWPHMTARQHLEYVIRKHNKLNGNGVASVTDRKLASEVKTTKDTKTTKKKMMGFFPPLRALRVLRGENNSSERIDKLLDAVNLNGHFDRYPHQLSGGEQQRLAIVRALAQDPQYLLMDEPFSNLDPILKTELESFIDQIQTESDIGIVYVTHNIKDLERITDQVVIMRDGRVIQNGEKEDVFNHPVDRFVEQILGL